MCDIITAKVQREKLQRVDEETDMGQQNLAF